MDTPVVFLIFNRPDLTRQVFAAIREARPRQLFVVADGPRADRPGEAELCAAARSIVEQVDWPCGIHQNFAEQNLGCARRVSTGLDWAFQFTDEAIILEDDCVPHPSFFRFCSELLAHYRHDQRVGCISGDNFQKGNWRGDGTYYFSKYPHCWGWATWARSWKNYDFDMTTWGTPTGDAALASVCQRPQEREYWRSLFDLVHAGRIDTWDYRWTFACWLHRTVTVLPNLNLVSNIGFGLDATHTRDATSSHAGMSVNDIGPLRHPSKLCIHDEADWCTFNQNFRPAPGRLGWHQRLRMKVGAWRRALVPSLSVR